MGKDSKISWTDHTFSPWWGCVKCDMGCVNCYANTLASRFGHDVWGRYKPRRLFPAKHWRAPLNWNAQAEKEGFSPKVFCASMCDVFEFHEDARWNAKLDHEREKLWALIGETSCLTWLLLTKRPENALHMTPWTNWPTNVWVGTSICDLPGRDRVLDLAEIPAIVKFISAEPLLDDIRPVKADWLILGGESEQRGKARPFPIDLARAAIAQHDEHGIPVFVKQMGTAWAKEMLVGGQSLYQQGDRKGERAEFWLSDLRRQEFPVPCQR